MRDPRVRFGVRRLIFAVAAVALALGILVPSLRWLQYPHITVTVFNETSAPISDLRITFLYGKRTAKQLGPGGVAVAEIQSGGESGVFFSYRDSSRIPRWDVPLHYSDSTASLDRGFLEAHVTNEEIRIVQHISNPTICELIPVRTIRVNPTGEMTVR
jgi:hypothetical protein